MSNMLKRTLPTPDVNNKRRCFWDGKPLLPWPKPKETKDEPEEFIIPQTAMPVLTEKQGRQLFWLNRPLVPQKKVKSFLPKIMKIKELVKETTAWDCLEGYEQASHHYLHGNK